MKIFKVVSLSVFLSALGCFSVTTASADSETEQSVFAFGGAMIDAEMFGALRVIAPYEHPIFGLGYQVFPGRIGSIKLGVEAGVAGRIGGGSSAEFWGGAVARHDGFQITDDVKLIPSFTFGISHVTRTQEGRERRHEEERDGDASTLFYLGPEIGLSFASMPKVDFFWRLHHRSGAWGTLGGMHGGSNANIVGVRYNF